MSAEFLVVDLPAQGLVLARHTAQVAGSRVDSIREGKQRRRDDQVLSSHLVRLQGFGDAQFQHLLEEMRATYPDIEVLESDPGARTWVLRNRVSSSHVQARQLLFLDRTEAEFGLYWTYIHNGKFQLRAEVADHAEAMQDVDRLTGVFRKAGVPVTARVSVLSDGDVAMSRLLRELLHRHQA